MVEVANAVVDPWTENKQDCNIVLSSIKRELNTEAHRKKTKVNSKLIRSIECLQFWHDGRK